MANKKGRGKCGKIFTAACLEGKSPKERDRIMMMMEPDDGSLAPPPNKQTKKPSIPAYCKKETVYRAECHPGFAPSALD